MPIYEYQCQSCGQITEARQKFSDPPLSECESCGGALNKLISQTAFTLKGDGWYQQGYSSKADKPSCAAAKDAPAGSACGSCPKAANE